MKRYTKLKNVWRASMGTIAPALGLIGVAQVSKQDIVVEENIEDEKKFQLVKKFFQIDLNKIVEEVGNKGKLPSENIKLYQDKIFEKINDFIKGTDQKSLFNDVEDLKKWLRLVSFDKSRELRLKFTEDFFGLFKADGGFFTRAIKSIVKKVNNKEINADYVNEKHFNGITSWSDFSKDVASDMGLEEMFPFLDLAPNVVKYKTELIDSKSEKGKSFKINFGILNKSTKKIENNFNIIQVIRKTYNLSEKYIALSNRAGVREDDNVFQEPKYDMKSGVYFSYPAWMKNGEIFLTDLLKNVPISGKSIKYTLNVRQIGFIPPIWIRRGPKKVFNLAKKAQLNLTGLKEVRKNMNLDDNSTLFDENVTFEVLNSSTNEELDAIVKNNFPNGLTFYQLVNFNNKTNKINLKNLMLSLKWKINSDGSRNLKLFVTGMDTGTSKSGWKAMFLQWLIKSEQENSNVSNAEPFIKANGFRKATSKEIVNEAIQELKEKDFDGKFIKKSVFVGEIDKETVLKLLKDNIFSELTSEQRSLILSENIEIKTNKESGELSISFINYGDKKDILIPGFKTIYDLAWEKVISIVENLKVSFNSILNFKKNMKASHDENQSPSIKEEILRVIMYEIKNDKDTESEIKNIEKEIIKAIDISFIPDDTKGSNTIKINGMKEDLKFNDIEIKGFLTNSDIVKDRILKLKKNMIENSFNKKQLPESFTSASVLKLFLESVFKDMTNDEKMIIKENEIVVLGDNKKGELKITIKGHGNDKEFKLTGFLTTIIKEDAQAHAINVMKQLDEDNDFKKIHFNKGKYATDEVNQNKEIKDEIISLLKDESHKHKNSQVWYEAKQILSKVKIKFIGYKENGKLEILIILDNNKKEELVAKKNISGFESYVKHLMEKMFLVEAKDILDKLDKNQDILPSTLTKTHIINKMLELEQISPLSDQIKLQLKEENIVLNPNDKEGKLEIRIEGLNDKSKSFDLTGFKKLTSAPKAYSVSKEINKSSSGIPAWQYILISLGVISAFVGALLLFIYLKKGKISNKFKRKK